MRRLLVLLLAVVALLVTSEARALTMTYQLSGEITEVFTVQENCPTSLCGNLPGMDVPLTGGTLQTVTHDTGLSVGDPITGTLEFLADGNLYGNYYNVDGYSTYASLEMAIGSQNFSPPTTDVRVAGIGEDLLFLDGSFLSGFFNSNLLPYPLDFFGLQLNGGTDPSTPLTAPYPSIVGVDIPLYLEFPTAMLTANSADFRYSAGMGVFRLNAAPASAPVPEPSTFLLLGGGLSGLAWYRRRKKE